MPWTVLAGAAGGPAPLVRDIGLCVLLAGLLTLLFNRLRIPSIAGLLAAGMFLGPEYLGRPFGGDFKGIISDRGNIETIANLGLVFLLFLIGLEIDLRKLLKSGRALIVTGIAQFPLCVGFGVAVGLAAASSGISFLQGEFVPLYLGFTAACSSTLLVVRILQKKQRVDTVVGRISIGVLIFQDMWAIIVLAIQPNILAPELSSVIGTFCGILALAAIAVVAARYLFLTAFSWIARSPELILVTAMAWCFGLGLLGSNLGTILSIFGLHVQVSVSLEMGALIAGASIASFPYSAQVVSKVGVVQEFFITLFFVGLGMQIPRPETAAPLLLALAIVALAFLSRALVFFPLMFFNGLDRRTSVVASTLLLPISEFCLVIAYLGMNYGHVSREFVGGVIFAFVATALLSPAALAIGDHVHEGLGPLLSRLGLHAPKGASDEDRAGREAPDVVLLGFHRVASSLVHEIGAQHPDLRSRITVVDYNAGIHREIKKRGVHVEYGDLSSSDVLQHAGVGAAKVILCTIPDELLKGTSNLRLVRGLRSMGSQAIIVVNALTTASVEELYEAGADFVYVPRVETAAGLVPVLSAALGGNMAEFRKAYDERFGPFPARDEVLP